VVDVSTNPTMSLGIGQNGRQVSGYWRSDSIDRATVDLNAAFDDLSVERYARAGWDLQTEDRLVSVQQVSGGRGGWPTVWQELVPRER